MARIIGGAHPLKIDMKGAEPSSAGSSRKLVREYRSFKRHGSSKSQWARVRRGVAGIKTVEPTTSVAVRYAQDDGEPELDSQLITGDLLLLWLHSLATEAFRVSQRPDFPGWDAPLNLPPDHFSHFLTDTVTVMGFWSIAGLVTGTFAVDSDSDEAVISAAMALLLSAPAIGIGLHLFHPEYRVEDIVAWGSGLATVMTSWRAFVVLYILTDENSP